jgi:hypothetical protein
MKKILFLLLSIFLLGCQKEKDIVTYNIRYEVDADYSKTYTDINYGCQEWQMNQYQFGVKDIKLTMYVDRPSKLIFNMRCSNVVDTIKGHIYISLDVNDETVWNNEGTDEVLISPYSGKTWSYIYYLN